MSTRQTEVPSRSSKTDVRRPRPRSETEPDGPPRRPAFVATVLALVLTAAVIVAGVALWMAMGEAGGANPPAEIESLYTPEEQRLLDAVSSGQVPRETLDPEIFPLER
jgi:hypothetical protein